MYIAYVKASDTPESNMLNHKFTGSDGAVTTEWDVVKPGGSTPGILTDGTVVRLAFLVGNAGDIQGTYGDVITPAPQQPPQFVFDPGARAVNHLRLTGVGSDTETVTIGEDVYELDTHDSPGTFTAGRLRVDVSGGTTAKAVGTLTSSGTRIEDETVTIGATVYRFRDTGNVDAAFDVLIGVDEEETLANLKAAINLEAGAGTKYHASTTIHPTVTATASDATTVDVEAKAGGVGGNSIASTETGANLAWGAATLGSGVSPTQAEVTAALVLAINNQGTEAVEAEQIASGEILLTSNTAQNLTLACTETLANGAWGAAAMYGGSAPGMRRFNMQKRIPTAQEVTVGKMHFKFDFVPTVKPIVKVITTSTGLEKAWVGAILQNGSRITLDNSGGTDWAATDEVYVILVG